MSSTEAQYITLQAWAATRFHVPPAGPALRRMAATGLIQPPPFKAGRLLYVDRDAEYVADDQPTALYRHFNAAGELLYVGISLHAVIRLTAHERGANWYREIATITVEHLPSRADALAAERRAIQEERPLHNIVHARRA